MRFSKIYSLIIILVLVQSILVSDVVWAKDDVQFTQNSQVSTLSPRFNISKELISEAYQKSEYLVLSKKKSVFENVESKICKELKKGPLIGKELMKRLPNIKVNFLWQVIMTSKKITTGFAGINYPRLEIEELSPVFLRVYLGLFTTIWLYRIKMILLLTIESLY